MSEISDETRDIAAAVLAGRESATAENRVTTVETLGIDIAVAVQRDGSVHVLKEAIGQAEQLMLEPIRRKGHVTLTEVDSFNAYVNRFKSPERTVVYASSAHRRLTAVFDEFRAGAVPVPDVEGDIDWQVGRAGWRQHRASYTCPLAPEWKTFTGAASKDMSQAAFGDFIEAQMEYLASGDGFAAPGDVLLMARSLVINSKGTFSRKLNPTTGESSLVCETDHGAESTKIPRAFLLALRVFEGGEAYAVEARLRFQMLNGTTPSFSFALHRQAEIELQAFTDVRAAVVKATGVPLFAGEAGE